jgi:hypothetical protein
MEPIVRIYTDNINGITITDITQEADEYLPESTEDSIAYYERNKFKYSETATINIISRTNAEGKEEFIDTIIMNHAVHLDELHYPIPQDGTYTIYHFILPTIGWAANHKEDIDELIKRGHPVYVCDCDKMYYFTDSENYEEKSSDVMATVNIENTTISRVELTHFSICNLYSCFISLCKKIYEKATLRCLSKNDFGDLQFSRDFVWMTINVIKYYIEKHQLKEAQRILEEINYCGGFCNEQRMSMQTGCGCAK